MAQTKTSNALVDAQIAELKKGAIEEKIKMLVEIGVLTTRHKLARKYKNWGSAAVSRTEAAEATPKGKAKAKGR